MDGLIWWAILLPVSIAALLGGTRTGTRPPPALQTTTGTWATQAATGIAGAVLLPAAAIHVRHHVATTAGTAALTLILVGVILVVTGGRSWTYAAAESPHPSPRWLPVAGAVVGISLTTAWMTQTVDGAGAVLALSAASFTLGATGVLVWAWAQGLPTTGSDVLDPPASRLRPRPDTATPRPEHAQPPRSFERPRAWGPLSATHRRAPHHEPHT